MADEIRRDRERDRIQPRERLVIQNQFRIERDRARERDSPRHAARYFGRIQAGRAAQADRLQFEQREFFDERFGQIGVVAQGERDIVEKGHIGEQAAELKQHPDAGDASDTNRRATYPRRCDRKRAPPRRWRALAR